jgi:cytochrome P450
MYNGLPQFLCEQYAKLGPVFRARALGQEMTVLAGLDAVNFVGSPEGKDSLESKPSWVGMVAEYGTEDTLVAADGELHTQYRNMMHRGYSRQALNARYDRLIETIDAWLNAYWAPGSIVAAVRRLQELIISELSITFADQLLFDDVDHIQTQVHWATNVHLLKRWPRFVLQLPKYRRAKARLMADASRVAEIFIARSKAAPDGVTGARLFDDLIAANKQYPDVLTGHDLPMTLFGPFLGGMDTASNTIAAILYALASNPECAKEVEREADNLFSDGTPDESTLFEKTPFLDAVIKESMRVYPSVPALMRHARHDFDFGGYGIQRGEPLMIATCVSWMSEPFFTDPQTFDPYRFIGEDRVRVPSGAFSPWGRGHHLCMGKRIAEVLIPLTVARIVNRKSYRLADHGYRLKNRFSYGVDLATDLHLRADASRNG